MLAAAVRLGRTGLPLLERLARYSGAGERLESIHQEERRHCLRNWMVRAYDPTPIRGVVA